MDATPENTPDAPAPPPDRPAAVPQAAVWNTEVGKWEVSRRDGDGARDGECLLYRDDGTLYARHRFVGGVQDGPFFVYHRDGGVAREGKYLRGRIDGLVTAYASDDPTGERLRVCCVPPGAARLCERYREGDFLLEVFYDRQGRAILSDGRLCPARPEGLPELAQFDEARGGWTQRSRALDRFWTAAGTLAEETESGSDGARVVRRFDAGGVLQEEAGFTAEGRLDGAFWRRFPATEPGPFADPRIRQERGAYAGGRPVGRWSFLDDDGQIVRAVDRGVAFREDDANVANVDSRVTVLGAAQDAADVDWPARARSLAETGRVREALVAAARGAAATRDRAVFERVIDDHVVPLVAERAAQWGEALVQAADTTVESALDALVSGADAAACLRALASVLPGYQPAATELVEASLLLAPERRLTHLTRALLRFQRGDRTGALADVDVVAGESAEAAESLRSYAAIVFRAFATFGTSDSGPGQETFAPDPELAGVSLEPAHTVDEVIQTVAVYATRIEQARAAIRALAGADEASPWLPPDPSHLLPSGPVALRHETVECEPEPQVDADADPAGDGAPGDAGPETIEIDERLIADGAGVPALLAAAHADWSALSWLCWAVGLDVVALPEDVVARPELASAMKMFVQRTWRLKDRLTTGGLVARSQGAPGFTWQGIEIDELPRHLTEMAAAEYVAVRSMFIWLASADAVSPFQDDIRDA